MPSLYGKNDPKDVVKVHQKVMVRVLEVDVARKRISLSLRKNPGPQAKQKSPSPQAPKQEAADLQSLQRAFMKQRS